MLIVNAERDSNNEEPPITASKNNVTVIVVSVVIVIISIGVLISVILLIICLRHNGKPNDFIYTYWCDLIIFFSGYCVSRLNVLQK